MWTVKESFLMGMCCLYPSIEFMENEKYELDQIFENYSIGSNLLLQLIKCASSISENVNRNNVFDFVIKQCTENNNNRFQNKHCVELITEIGFSTND